MMQQFLALICLSIASQICVTISQTTTATWCTVATNEQAKCEAMKTAFTKANLVPSLACVQGTDTFDCLSKIHTGAADLITLDGGDIYTAGIEYGVKTVMAETYSDGDGYYAVAVAKNSDTSMTLNSLKGKRSCHTGVKKTAGWNVPVGYLLGEGLMDVVDCNSDIKSAGMFFSESCAPGALSAKYNPNEDNPPSLCETCIGQGNYKCARNSSEPYYNYHGAFRCLAEGSGDVAFVKHLTVQENTDGNGDQWAQNLKSTNYVLLCPDGTRKPVTEYKSCNLAWVPSHAVITAASATMEKINSYRKLLDDGQKLYGTDGNPEFDMFDSANFQGKDLLFKDSTVSLNNTDSTEYATYLGVPYINTIRGLAACPAGSARWCVVSDGEFDKCEAMKKAFATENLKPDISCPRAQNQEGCMRQIRDGQADLVTLDGGDIVTAGNTYKMQPVAGENYGKEDATASYWAVAVAKKGTDFGFDDLQGKKSCHTGIMKTSGWIVPIGTLMDRGEITVEDCNVPVAVGAYFSSSCVPGAKTPTYDPDNLNPENLCDLCIGQGEDNCVRNNNEPYYGYTGAFRCLAEGAGEVAFVKHVTVGDNTNGNNAAPWASGLDKADFELLCPDGSRKAVDDWLTCNLARVPSHAVMTSGSKSTEVKEEYWNLLKDGQGIFASDTGTGFRMFDSEGYEGSDLIFKDSTVNLVDVGEKDTYQKWAGEEYLKSYEAVTCLRLPASGAGQITTSVAVTLVSLVVAVLSCIYN
ncbi:melanotransferrin-like [Anneissia japonica]|uniref:melanotransferrin-like n=1 Tax=Anneissia japonica TaxID=1529436 RepID=UPI001425712E|nr:melanotransferrin-like [Anneissia japonica]